MTVEVEIDDSVFLPKYRHLIDSNYDIDFLYGGRDSGKSVFIAQNLIKDCLELDYFRCILIKKTYESIKDAQFQTIKDIVNDWGMNDLFKFKESPLEITCINGNKFIARGCDKPAKLKSISNPSHAWYEEGNQLEEQDYVIASTTLRSNKGRVKEWFSFNPEFTGDIDDFWLYKQYFKDKPKCADFTATNTVEVQGTKVHLNYQVTHSTYRDNPFCNLERIAKFELLGKFNPYYYKVYTLGQWGSHRATGAEFYTGFDRAVHVGNYPFIDELPVHLSFDFNVVPYMTMLCCQIREKNNKTYFRFFDEYCKANPDNTSRAITQYFVRDFAHLKPTVFYYGDYSGKSRIAGQGNKRNFDDIEAVLMPFLNSASDRVTHKNPNVFKARDFINLLFGGFWPDIVIEIDEGCKELIADFENCKVCITGKDKSLFHDKVLGISYQKHGHTSDAFTYLVIEALYALYKSFSKLG